MPKSIRKELSGLAANLWYGARLVCFRPVEAKFHYSLHQVVLLVLVNVLLAVVVGYLRELPNPQFNVYAVSGEALGLAGALFVAYLIAATTHKPNNSLRFLVQLYCVTPYFYLITVALRTALPSSSVGIAWGIYLLALLWLIAVVVLILHRQGGRRARLTSLYFVVFLAFVVLPPFLVRSGEYWYPGVAVHEAAAALPKVNQENVYYAQPGLVAAAMRDIAPGRRGVTDLYFVGFGSYGGQDVFMKEVRFARDMLDRHFDTKNRSVVMINNLATVNDVPLATGSNLKEVLRRIGRAMNRDEDILFLFLTSHGSKQHELSVSLSNLWLNDITPSTLKGALDNARIKWRVLVISACYSGGFIEALKDDYTLIATAAAPNKQSFGCGNDSEMTYFGKAVFDEQLKTERYLPAAFERAAASISARETAEGKERSEPRLYVGTAIEPKLRSLEKRLR